MKHSVECLTFKPVRKGASLIGFADIQINEMRLVIKNISLHRRGHSHWVSPPGAAWIKDNTVVLKDGKPVYSQVIEFTDRATSRAFSEAVWRTVEAFDPEVVAP
jgi:hypothetical protein